MREVSRIPSRQNKKGDLIAKVNEIKLRIGKVIEFEMSVKGKQLTAIFDTGGSITMMPRKLREWVKPNSEYSPPDDREFVDLNGNEVKIRRVYELDTCLNGVTKRSRWWELEARTKPIVGMDSFEILQLNQKHRNQEIENHRKIKK